jgi:hypothetical protein
MPKLFEKQTQHLLALLVLLPCVFFIARGKGFQVGQFLGLPTQTWLWISIAVPVIHQVVVIFTWRAELHNNLMSKWFGEKAFWVWGIGFMVLFIARPLSIIGLAISNRDSIPIHPLVGLILATLCLPFIIYLGYSIHKYFGLNRALGIDHFEPKKYRNMSFVRGGIFRCSPNAMYKFGFLALWVPGLLLLSKAALLSALFSHIYIWVHYYCTELPDIRHIYGKQEQS